MSAKAMTVAGILSLIPGAGSAIQCLLDGRARANVERRWLELFIEVRKGIEEVRDRIPDAAFHGSEEFQTLLALAQEQLWITHDKKKLKSLAAALAKAWNFWALLINLPVERHKNPRGLQLIGP